MRVKTGSGELKLEDCKLKTNRRYQCIAFDAVGTIIQPTPPAGEVYYEVARRFGSRLGHDDIGRRFRRAFRETERGDMAAEAGIRLLTSETREKERWRRIVATVIDDIPDSSGCFAELFAHFARPESWKCFDEVPAVLAELRAAGYRVAIASNFDRRLHPVCDGFATLRGIDVRIISSEVGCRKPGRGFFEAVVARAGCRPDEVLMVGDDVGNDIDGARKAGLGAVLINRRGVPGPGEIGSLAELPDWIAGRHTPGGTP
jgi:putative hydrolase of the HAD superfamily